jgi:hypothetical protein
MCRTSEIYINTIQKFQLISHRRRSVSSARTESADVVWRSKRKSFKKTQIIYFQNSKFFNLNQAYIKLPVALLRQERWSKGVINDI